ncbi:MAG: hypothetical protein EZS28_004184 [Streblomastix strix]|uniref:Uncharacterized protein n=1 Tax=Streblomastix strix TaxID=222440 RepID=A0A5J4WYW6_9EUKA|nr:MAG: hypothetical protein EZS28_004184 [Streblomastix strix]
MSNIINFFRLILLELSFFLEIAHELNILTGAGDYKQQTYSHHTSTNFSIGSCQQKKRHREIAIDELNQTWKKEFLGIHPPIPLLPAVLKKIGEEQIEAMIFAPLWPGQIWYTELVNQNVQSLMFGWSSKILVPGTSLIKKNLKLPPGKICCFLMDRGPEKEKDIHEEFQIPQINIREQQI